MATNFTGSPITDPDELGYVTTTNIATTWAGTPTEELIIDYSNKLIGLYVGSSASPSNLTNEGVTIKAIYSKLKDAWRSDSTLVKFAFPMSPITDESFEMVNGWNWDAGKSVSPERTSGTEGVLAETTELIRTGGWTVVDGNGDITEEWAGIITLGELADNADQVYYDQTNDETTDNTGNFVLTGRVNQALKIFDSAPSPDLSYKTYLKLYVREWGKTFVSSEFSEIGVTTAQAQAYRFPLANVTDTNIVRAEEVILGSAGFITGTSGDGSTYQEYTTSSAHGLSTGDVVTISGASPTAGYNAVSATITAVPSNVTFRIAGTESGASSTAAVQLDLYASMSITYARDADNDRVLNEAPISGTQGYVRGAWQSGIAYNVGDVVSSSEATPRWYIVTVAGTSSGDSSNLTGGSDTGVSWASYSFEREINSDYFAFTVAIDGDTGTPNPNDGDATSDYIYEFVQAELRKTTDIDGASPGTVIGKVTDVLLSFVGPTLITERGVYVDSFNSADQNSIEFYDYSNTSRTFDFVSLFTINFGANLQADPYAKYFVFFTTAGAGNYGTANAVLVNHIDTVPGTMDGNVNPGQTPNERTSVSHLYDYDNNIQQGSGTNGAPVNVTVVGIGLEKSQWVLTTGTIGRDKTSNVSLISAQERNYAQGTTFP